MMDLAPGSNSAGLVPLITRDSVYHGSPSICPSRMRSSAASLSDVKSSALATPTRSNPQARACALTIDFRSDMVSRS